MFGTTILLIIILFVLLAIKNFDFAIYFVFVLLPTYRVQFSVFEVPMNLLSVFIWIIVFVWIIKNIKSILLSFKSILLNPKSAILRKNILENFRWPIVLILISSMISVFVSYDMTKALGLFKSYFLESIFFFIVLIYTIKTKKQFKNIIYSLGMLSIFIFIISLYQKLSGNFTFNTTGIIEDGRVISFFGYPNANGLILLPIFFLNLINLFEDKKLYLKIFNSLIFVFACLTIFWSKSESAIIAIIGTLLIFALFKLFNKKKLFVFISMIILAISILFPFITKSPKNIDLPNSREYSMKEKLLLQDLSGQIRRQMYGETKKLILEKPIFGSGLNGFQKDSSKYHKYDYIEIFLYPHSIFLNFWIAIGIFGMLGFIWLIILLLNRATKEYFNGSKEQIFVLLTMLAIIIQGIVEVPYFKNDLSIVWWLVFLGFTVFKNEKKKFIEV